MTKFFVMSVIYLFSNYSIALCPDRNNSFYLLQWSKDGKSVLLQGSFGNFTELFLVDGEKGEIKTYTLDQFGPKEYSAKKADRFLDYNKTANEISIRACEQSMRILNTNLEKYQFKKLPLAKKPCQAKGRRNLSKEDLGGERSAIRNDIFSPAKNIKIEAPMTSYTEVCGGNIELSIFVRVGESEKFKKIQTW